MRQPGTRGLTLIELVAAMAVFALVAVTGLQALNGTLRMRDRLGAAAHEAGDLGLALSLLRHDLSAALPLLFHPPGDAPARSALYLSADRRVLAVSVGGQPDLPAGEGLGMHRIEWRHDPVEKTLSRRIWPVLQPASPRAVQPWMPVLEGVAGFSLRSHWPRRGWVDGATSGELRAAAEERGADRDGVLRAIRESYSDTLPEAVEITLEIDGPGRITLVESLK